MISQLLPTILLAEFPEPQACKQKPSHRKQWQRCKLTIGQATCANSAMVIERTLLLMSRESCDEVACEHLPSEIIDAGLSIPAGEGLEQIIGLPLREARERFEREYLIAQINRFGGNISRTAAFIGMERSALHRKLKALGVTGASRVEHA